jgi:hypothetical protein
LDEEDEDEQGVAGLLNLHADSKLLERDVKAREARLKTIAGGMGGLPLEPSGLRERLGEEGDEEEKESIAGTVEELVAERQAWLRQRGYLASFVPFNGLLPPSQEIDAHRRTYAMLTKCVSEGKTLKDCGWQPEGGGPAAEEAPEDAAPKHRQSLHQLVAARAAPQQRRRLSSELSIGTESSELGLKMTAKKALRRGRSVKGRTLVERTSSNQL